MSRNQGRLSSGDTAWILSQGHSGQDPATVRLWAPDAASSRTLLLSPEQWKAQFPRGAGILPPQGDSDHGFPQGCHKMEQSPQLFIILFDPHNLVTRFPKIWYLGTVNTLRIWEAALAGGTFWLSPEVGCKALVWEVPSLTWREASLFPKTTEHRGGHRLG